MAKDTKYTLLKESIYQVFPRCYSKEGTLKVVKNNLEHIKEMGFTILYFLPLHEPGTLNKKGSLGCPYSIKDYYGIDPKNGSLQDFKDLIDKAHKLGLKIMTDIVINHTSCDATWTKTNPEFYYLENGKPSQKIKDWSDVYDLEYTKPELQEELIKMMVYWAKFGVDGFRCDVAPIVPLNFWIRARKALKEVNPDFFMLAESGEQFFVEKLREEDICVSTDPELYEAFDICYCYDVQEFFKDAIKQDSDLVRYAMALGLQQSLLQKNSIKAWFLENHDQERILSKLKDKEKVINWTAFTLLLKGIGFVYAGQEAFEIRRPSLFEKEDITWADKDEAFEKLIAKCNSLKQSMFDYKEYINLKMIPYKDILAFRQYNKESEYIAYFDVKNLKGEVEVTLNDGIYLNLIDDNKIEVKNHLLKVDRPIMVKVK